MGTIEQIQSTKTTGNLLYYKGLRATVVDTCTLVQDNNKLVVILADKTSFIKMIVNDTKRQKEFHGKTVIIRNFVKGYSCLFAKPTTTVSVAQSMEIPPCILTQARQILQPTSSECVPLKDVTETNKGTFLTVEAVIIAVSYTKRLTIDLMICSIFSSYIVHHFCALCV